MWDFAHGYAALSRGDAAAARMVRSSGSKKPRARPPPPSVSILRTSVLGIVSAILEGEIVRMIRRSGCAISRSTRAVALQDRFVDRRSRAVSVRGATLAGRGAASRRSGLRRPNASIARILPATRTTAGRWSGCSRLSKDRERVRGKWTKICARAGRARTFESAPRAFESAPNLTDSRSLPAEAGSHESHVGAGFRLFINCGFRLQPEGCVRR